jgi:hypothetical protein
MQNAAAALAFFYPSDVIFKHATKEQGNVARQTKERSHDGIATSVFSQLEHALWVVQQSCCKYVLVFLLTMPER